MKTIKLMEKLREKPVFTVQDIGRIADCDKKYAWLTINRLLKNKLIKRVRRNLYTTKTDAFVIASNVITPSYISFWSASYYLGFTEQIVNTVFVATTRKAKPIEFEGYRIEFVPISDFFGFGKIRTDEGEIFIADSEKLLIDAFIRPGKCGNFDEIIKMFENADIDEGKLIAYLKKTKKQALIKRVGFLLEKTKGMDISGHFNLDRNYVLLNPFMAKSTGLNPKWRVKL